MDLLLLRNRTRIAIDENRARTGKSVGIRIMHKIVFAHPASVSMTAEQRLPTAKNASVAGTKQRAELFDANSRQGREKEAGIAAGLFFVGWGTRIRT